MSELSSLDARFRPWAEWLVEVARFYGLDPYVTSARRSHQTQARLYREYLQGKRTIPVAQPGTSAHEFGLAFDLVAKDLPGLGSIWSSVGGRWGGSGDPVHFGVW